jgi:hypothetical protein
MTTAALSTASPVQSIRNALTRTVTPRSPPDSLAWLVGSHGYCGTTLASYIQTFSSRAVSSRSGSSA